jgi:hypothetical protein
MTAVEPPATADMDEEEMRYWTQIYLAARDGYRALADLRIEQKPAALALIEAMVAKEEKTWVDAVQANN